MRLDTQLFPTLIISGEHHRGVTFLSSQESLRNQDSLLEGFIKCLGVRVPDQQQVIANLATVDTERRLGTTLLQIAKEFGKKDPRSIRIEV
jgi:hypothetical protein